MTTVLILVLAIPVAIGYLYIKQELDLRNKLLEIKKILASAQF